MYLKRKEYEDLPKSLSMFWGTIYRIILNIFCILFLPSFAPEKMIELHA